VKMTNGCASVAEGLEVASHSQSVRMVKTQHPLMDGQGALEAGPRSSQVTLGPQQRTEVAQAGGGVGVVWAEHPLMDGQGTLQVGASTGQVTLGLQQEAEVAQAGGRVGVLSPQHPLIDGQGTLQRIRRLHELCSCPQIRTYFGQ